MPRYTDVDAFGHALDTLREQTDRYHEICKLREFKELLAVAPIETEVRAVVRGRWEMKADKGFVCSVCGAAFLYTTNFCGECGAVMEEGNVL